jgi:hypothetical protein
MPLSDTKLDEMLAGLRAAQSPEALVSDDGFHNNVWLRGSAHVRDRTGRGFWNGRAACDGYEPNQPFDWRGGLLACQPSSRFTVTVMSI